MPLKGTILAVDDNPVNLMAYREMLASDFSLYTASSGQEGLALAQRVQPDVVLLDVLMPEMDGFETCRQFRRQVKTDAKIMLVSAAGERDYRLDGYRAGADDYIARPFDEHEFLAKVTRQVAQQMTLRDRFRQGQKMEAIGRLAGGVAHDFNNLLVVINGYSDILLNDPALPSHLCGAVMEIERAGQRAAALTRQLLAFGRRSMLNPQLLDVNALVAECLGMLKRLLGEDVRMCTHYAAGLGRVNVDRAQLEQAIVNLVVNARDAMPQGGTLTLATDRCEIQPDDTDPDQTPSPGRYIVLSVQDTGCGMDEEIRSRIFEPFFSTKAPGEGSGLGLATVHGFAVQSGGHIDVVSQPGHGSLFRLFLPEVDAEEAVAAVPAPESQATEGRETILLIEDDHSVRSLVRRVLTACGYTLLEATNGAAAISMLEHCLEPVHLIIADVVMPYMSGPSAVGQIQRRHPEIRVLFMSGYTDDVVVRHGAASGGIELLHKPFSPAELARRVRRVLDRSAAEDQAPSGNGCHLAT